MFFYVIKRTSPAGVAVLPIASRRPFLPTEHLHLLLFDTTYPPASELFVFRDLPVREGLLEKEDVDPEKKDRKAHEYDCREKGFQL